MARYRKIDVRIWGDERVRRLSSPRPCGKFLWVYLLANPNTTNIPGLYRAGEAQLAEELGWPLEAFREAFREVIREGLAEADWEARVIWIPGAIKYNQPESINVVKSWATPWDEIPECGLKTKAFQEFLAFLEGFRHAFAEAFAKACAKPSGKAYAYQDQDQDQDQDQEPEQDPDTRARVGVDLNRMNAPYAPGTFGERIGVSPQKTTNDDPGANSNARAIKDGSISGYDLARRFSLIRAECVPNTLPWQTPADKDNSIREFARQLTDDAVVDVPMTMRRLFEHAVAEDPDWEDGRLRSDPTWAFAVWRSRFTRLREEIRGVTPGVTQKGSKLPPSFEEVQRVAKEGRERANREAKPETEEDLAAIKRGMKALGIGQ